MKNSFRPYGFFYLTKLMSYIPTSLCIWLANDSSSRFDMGFSNVAGPKTSIVYEGVECRNMIYLPPSISAASNALACISMCDKMTVCMMSDAVACDKPEEIIELYSQTCA